MSNLSNPRRKFLKNSVGAMVTAMISENLLASSKKEYSTKEVVNRPYDGAKTDGYNVLLIINDQERYFPEWPFPLPAHEEIKKRGITFKNHQAASCVCSSARSVIYTGQHIQKTGIFDNMDFVWQKDLPTSLPTIGTYLKKMGYYTAYRGKWHLSSTLMKTYNIEDIPWHDYTEAMKEYGFEDYLGIGDMLDAVLGGYQYDSVSLGLVETWLRGTGKPLNTKGQPWFMALNFVNPHDSMFFNSDREDESVQSGTGSAFGIARAPKNDLYSKSWTNVPLPESRHQSMNEQGRPKAHGIFLSANAALVGKWPDEDYRWRGLQDFYFNSMCDVDNKMQVVLNTLKETGLLDNTIVIVSADHGELGGFHGLRNKGTTAYKEQNHIPLMIIHPDYQGGKTCDAMTSQLDITPTIISMVAGNDTTKKKDMDDLPGHDFSGLLKNPEAAAINAIRAGTLYNYDMLTFSDTGVWSNQSFLTPAYAKMTKIEQEKWIEKYPPNLNNRCAIRSIFNGKYRYSRYFGNGNFKTYKSFEDLIANCDLELYDMEIDAAELNNLAAEPKKNKELIMKMDSELLLLIEKEVGIDDGSFLPIKNGKLYFADINK